MYVYTTTTKIVFFGGYRTFFICFVDYLFLYDFKGVFDMVEKKTDRRILKTKTCAQREPALFIKRTANTKNIRFPPM